MLAVFVHLLLVATRSATGMEGLSFSSIRYFRDELEPAVTLVMAWLPGVCSSEIHEVDPQRRCRIEALRPFWTIKELRGMRRNCNPDAHVFGKLLKTNSQFQLSIPNELRSELFQHWPSVYESTSAYVQFWTAHYRRDGSCFRGNPLLASTYKFFTATLYLAKRLDVFENFLRVGLVPSEFAYQKRFLVETLKMIHGAQVRLRCPRRTDILEEVEFCMDHLLQPRDCKRIFFHEECGPHLYYMQPPPSAEDSGPVYTLNPSEPPLSVPDHCYMSSRPACVELPLAAGGRGTDSADPKAEIVAVKMEDKTTIEKTTQNARHSTRVDQTSPRSSVDSVEQRHHCGTDCDV
ncbi:ribonuclease DdI-like [Tropilaelaps mercedesae]|uniref:Ribonuclease DdI-like n=1 Tax=Tropilaelaps mercedesae TaxID=418985 RepID=A0A1V9XP39_9ACAR|nr:ribonuclease DdI-like [Tropilaelaps mercedesae]